MNKALVLLVGLLIGGVGFLLGSNNVVVETLGGGYPYANPFTSGTASTTSVGTGNNLVLATSTSREIVTITNDGSQAVFLNFGTAAVTGQGYMLTPSSTLVVSPQGELYTRGSINAVAEGTVDLSLFFKHTAE